MHHALLLIVLSTLLTAGCRRPPEAIYTLELPSAAQLKEKAPIYFKGIAVGYIADLRLPALGSGDTAGVLATCHLTDPNMHLLRGDTAKVVTTSLLGEPQIEITRAAEANAPLPPASTIPASLPTPPATSLADILELGSELRDLPPDRRKRVVEQLRTVVQAAKGE